jgi:hypothetical protein
VARPPKKVAAGSIEAADAAEERQALASRSSAPLRAPCDQAGRWRGCARGKDKAVMSSVDLRVERMSFRTLVMIV